MLEYAGMMGMGGNGFAFFLVWGYTQINPLPRLTYLSTQNSAIHICGINSMPCHVVSSQQVSYTRSAPLQPKA